MCVCVWVVTSPAHQSIDRCVCVCTHMAVCVTHMHAEVTYTTYVHMQSDTIRQDKIGWDRDIG